jgi:hypothetical protein
LKEVEKAHQRGQKGPSKRSKGKAMEDGNYLNCMEDDNF